MQQRFYFDTSVFGGVFDTEFEEETLLLFEKVKLGQINTNRTVSGGKTKTTESGSKTMTLAERMKAAKNK